MKVLSSFLHLDHTPSLDQKIKEVSAKISKFLDDKGTIKWICYVRNNEHFAEINCYAPHHEYHAKAISSNMYESIEAAIAKIEKQIFKNKDKFNKLHRGRVELEAIGA